MLRRIGHFLGQALLLVATLVTAFAAIVAGSLIALTVAKATDGLFRVVDSYLMSLVK